MDPGGQRTGELYPRPAALCARLVRMWWRKRLGKVHWAKFVKFAEVYHKEAFFSGEHGRVARHSRLGHDDLWDHLDADGVLHNGRVLGR